MKKVAIVIPAYNEEKRIGRTLEEYSLFFNALTEKKEFDYEIIVVINNTTDKTEEVVKLAIKRNRKISFINLKSGGKGFAVIEGFKDALKRNNDLIGFVDADMATPPEECYKLIKSIERYDGAIASRYIKGAVIKPKPTIQRLIAKRMFNDFVRVLLFLQFRDTQCGAKIFKRDVIRTVLPSLTMSQWAFDVELLYLMRRKGFSIREFPTRWLDKEYSKINFWRAGPRMALGVVRLRLLNSPFRKFINLYDSLLEQLRK